jgi:disulfide bond formation protein DsbB
MVRARRRLLSSLGAIACGALMGYALYAQHVLGLEPCPLCIFQRIAMIALGIVFVVAAVHAPRGGAARVYAVLGALVAAVGAGISGWHIHVQHLPEDQVPACGPGLGYMWDTFPLRDVLNMVFNGSGECHAVNWSFMGLAMPTWVLVWFVALGALIAAANWARLER